MDEKIEELALALGCTAKDIWRWRNRRKVPDRWQVRILELALRRGVELLGSHFEDFGAKRRRLLRRQAREKGAAAC